MFRYLDPSCFSTKKSSTFCHINFVFNSISVIFFLSGFSFTDTNNSWQSWTSFIPLYHLHPLKNIQTFIDNFACEMTTTYFWSHRSYLPDFYSMRFTTLSYYHLIDWLMMKCSFVYFMIWFQVFVTAIWQGTPVDLRSHRLSQATRLTKCASHPRVNWWINSLET